MKASEYQDLARLARDDVKDRWDEVETLCKKISLKDVAKIEVSHILDALASPKLALAAKVFAETVLEDTPLVDQKQDPQSSTSHVFAAVQQGLVAVILCRLDIMVLKSDKTLSNALARALKILASSEKSPKDPEADSDADSALSRKGGRKPKKTLEEEIALTEKTIKLELRRLKRLKQELNGNKDEHNMSKKNRKKPAINNPGKFAEENVGFPEVLEEDGYEKKQSALLRSVISGKLERVKDDTKYPYILSKTALAYRLKTEIKVMVESETPIPSRTVFEERTRVDLNISVREMSVLVEIKTDSLGNRHYGDTSHLGPEGTRYTWSAFANILCLHAGYAIPLNRIETIFGGKPFTRSMMVSCIENFSAKYLPVYLHMAKDIVANASIINVDDAHTRTNETTSFLNKVKAQKRSLLEQKAENNANQNPTDEQEWLSVPWSKPDSLVSQLDDHFNLYPNAADGVLRADKSGIQYDVNIENIKLKLQTTVITCLDEANRKEPDVVDLNTPISYLNQDRVIFYRSDFKSAGWLLGELLCLRSPDKMSRPVYIQGDMSPENNVYAPTVSQPEPSEISENQSKSEELKPVPLPLPTVIYAGCSAHARRPFYRHRDDDPELCDLMLGLFRDIAAMERMLTNHQMSQAEIIKVREEGEKPIWQAIMFACWQYLDKWSSATPLGSAIRYVLRHSDENIVYLTNANLDSTNNISENLARFEALNNSSSFGCDTLEGRMRLDILRTGYASALGSSIDPKAYIVFAMLANQDNIEEEPEKYTPAAFKKWQRIELEKAKPCPCCGMLFSENTQLSLKSGVPSCFSNCAFSAAKRTILVIDQKF